MRVIGLDVHRTMAVVASWTAPVSAAAAGLISPGMP